MTENGSSKLNYPSAMCLSTPCLMIDIDTTVATTSNIVFTLYVITTRAADSSSIVDSNGQVLMPSSSSAVADSGGYEYQMELS
jgi:hypothetical protein